MTSGDPSVVGDQYNALRSSGGVVELAGWSSVALTGRDRQAFLHNFCTNEVKRLAAGENCEAFITNAKGKIVGHGLITCRDDELVLVGAPNQGPLLVAHLDRYIIREDVQLQNTSSERSYSLIAGGPAARERLSALVPAIAGWGLADTRLVNVGATIAGISVRCILWDLIGSDFQCVLETSKGDQQQLVQSLEEVGFETCDLATFTALRIENGMPLFGVDFDDNNLPQEIGRDRQAISFTKGCYLGQETVARIDALGHVNQRLVGVRFSSDVAPAAGADLLRGGGVVGRVTSVARSPTLVAPLALAMVRRDGNAIGTRLDSAVGEGEVIALPLL